MNEASNPVGARTEAYSELTPRVPKELKLLLGGDWFLPGSLLHSRHEIPMALGSTEAYKPGSFFWGGNSAQSGAPALGL